MIDSPSPRPTIGIALSGGAARGFAHIGVLKVLHEAGIPIDSIAGTSVGSIVGAAYASGTSFPEMLKVCSTMRWRDIAQLTLSKRGIASIDRSDQFLTRLIKAQSFEHLGRRFYAVATDIRSGELIVLSRGDLKRALQASCAIPGFFVPVEVQGRSLVDGGVVANLPVLPLRQLGVQKIIAVDVSSRFDKLNPPDNVFQIMVQSLFIIGRAASRTAREQADLLVEPRVFQYEWDEFEQCEAIVEAGAKAMRELLPKVQEWLPAEKPSLWRRLRKAFRPSQDA